MASVIVRSPPSTAAIEWVEPRFPRIGLYLVSGCHPRGRESAWLLVSAEGSAVSSLGQAQLFPFDLAGCRAALRAARGLVRGPLVGHRAFTARVVVTGDPRQPEDVIEAWRLEGPKPVNLGRYPFEVSASRPASSA
jgi:hypothetical protein